MLQIETQLRDARRPLDLFWKQHQADLQHVRTVAAGHRDHDGLAILRVTENINIDTSLVVSSSLGQILDDIAAVLQAIVVQTASLAPPEA